MIDLWTASATVNYIWYYYTKQFSLTQLISVSNYIESCYNWNIVQHVCSLFVIHQHCIRRFMNTFIIFSWSYYIVWLDPWIKVATLLGIFSDNLCRDSFTIAAWKSVKFLYVIVENQNTKMNFIFKR